MTEFPASILFDDARAILQRVAMAQRLPVEHVALAHCHGRVLAQDIVAPIALQPFDNSAMDGYACRHADLHGQEFVQLKLVGEQFAGRALGLQVGEGECVRITTGAPMPQGADSVVIREDSSANGGAITLRAGVRLGANVRKAGEDAQPGDPVLRAGTLLNAVQVSLAASLGIDRLPVSTKPTAAVFATGDELVEPGLPLQPGEIYNSNRELLMGLLRAEGLEPMAWPSLPDDPARIAAMLQDAASSFDIVITCGAVSAGEKDHIPAMLQTHGSVHFWKVKMKPGMPLLAGQLGQAQFLGLPGNPVSVLATFLTLGRELVDGMQGRTPRPRRFARLDVAIDKSHPRREFVRGSLRCDEAGMQWIAPNAATGSHRLRAAADADALLILAEGTQSLVRGEVVEVLTY
ncbi:gephyrin-like molybdotransferase Glp [Thermomonas sp. HDW16]|uniref:molybdopterin molybdotransferase MoeA n=1 Tax=Thermomonas sp. HDW16 TaxID=2714945 RepID=UPI00140B80C0|nr:gephyrin-like molybdotransferase Glp [Thermomonas sp. HDW16]QIL20607.1 molybdopterin molybdotransferase MoeA [Thermomonas sp. HDW16]